MSVDDDDPRHLQVARALQHENEQAWIRERHRCQRLVLDNDQLRADLDQLRADLDTARAQLAAEQEAGRQYRERISVEESALARERDLTQKLGARLERLQIAAPLACRAWEHTPNYSVHEIRVMMRELRTLIGAPREDVKRAINIRVGERVRYLGPLIKRPADRSCLETGETGVVISVTPPRIARFHPELSQDGYATVRYATWYGGRCIHPHGEGKRWERVSTPGGGTGEKP